MKDFSVLTRYEKWLWFSVTTLVFLYIIIRGIYNPLLHDEIATLFHFVQSGDYLMNASGTVIWDANNHLLNTFLTELCYNSFGNSAISLRLPNIITFPIYAYFIAKIVVFLKSKYIRTLSFIALISVTYLIEYFSLTRGYGMSMAFIAGAIYYINKWIKKLSLKALGFGLLFTLLACYANLTLINSFGLILLFVLFHIIIQKQRISIRVALLHFLLIAISCLIIIYPILFSFQLKATGALYYGGKSGLWQETGVTLTELIFFGSKSIIFGALYLIVYVFGAVVVLFRKKNEVSLSSNPLFFFLYLLIGNIIGSIFLVHFLDVNYPSDRAAMFLIPFTLLVFCFAIDRIKIGTYLSLILIYFPISFIVNLSIQGSLFSPGERVSSLLYESVVKCGLKNPTIGAYQTNILCWNYYEQQNNNSTSFAFPNKENDTLYDILVNKGVLIDSAKILPLYNIIAKEKATQINVLQRKKALKWQPLKSMQTKAHSSNQEYFNLLEFKVLEKGPLKFNLKAKIETEFNYFKANIVLSGRNKKNEEVEYQYIKLDWVYPNCKLRTVEESFILNNPEVEEVVIYLWNIDKKQYAINPASIDLGIIKK